VDDVPVAGRIYTVGYEGLTLDGLIDRLRGAKVTTVVDVRLTPSSRKPGFSRKRLSEALDEVGISYIHEGELGNPPGNRDSFRRGDGQEGRERMRALLSNGAGEALDRVVALAAEERIAVLCFERERQRCHRDVITEMAVERNPAIDIVPML